MKQHSLFIVRLCCLTMAQCTMLLTLYAACYVPVQLNNIYVVVLHIVSVTCFRYDLNMNTAIGLNPI